MPNIDFAGIAAVLAALTALVGAVVNAILALRTHQGVAEVKQLTSKLAKEVNGYANGHGDGHPPLDVGPPG